MTLGRDSAVSRGHRRGLTALFSHPAPLCALKLLSKELLSIRSRRPHRSRAKSLVCLQKHINLLQSAMKGSSCPPKQDGGHIQAWLGFPKCMWSKVCVLHPTAPHPSPPSSASPCVQRKRHQNPNLFNFLLVFFFLFFSSPLKEFRAHLLPAQTQRRKFPGIAALSGKFITGAQAVELMPGTSCPVFGTLYPGCTQHSPGTSTFSQQGLMPHEGYKLIFLRRMADLSVFPLLIEAWLWAHQAEEAILK